MYYVVKKPSSEKSPVSHWRKRSLTQWIVKNKWRMSSHPQHQYSPRGSEPQSDARSILHTAPCRCLNIKGGRYVVCVFTVLERRWMCLSNWSKKWIQSQTLISRPTQTWMYSGWSAQNRWLGGGANVEHYNRNKLNSCSSPTSRQSHLSSSRGNMFKTIFCQWLLTHFQNLDWAPRSPRANELSTRSLKKTWWAKVWGAQDLVGRGGVLDDELVKCRPPTSGLLGEHFNIGLHWLHNNEVSLPEDW